MAETSEYFSSVFRTKHWHTLDNDKIQCDVCPRFCQLSEGQRGMCFVRARQNDEVVLTTYGLSSGFCIDPIEKKPLNHFYPGTPVLSFGTAGCNLSCKFCQNWDISKSRETASLADKANPEQIANAASRSGCKSLAFTYNDPVIFMEYAIDVAAAAHEQGIKTVAVTAGYICSEARREFFSCIDAANVDLKAFTQSFYHELCGGDLDNVLKTLQYLKHETDIWFEITTLLIPGKNDSAEEIDAMTTWIVQNLGCDVPLHFSAFHPDYKLRDIKATPLETLRNARQIAKDNGISYVYTGNVYDKEGGSTYCQNCKNNLITRNWYEISTYQLDDSGHCARCGTKCPGRFDGPAGSWGQKRLAIRP